MAIGFGVAPIAAWAIIASTACSSDPPVVACSGSACDAAVDAPACKTDCGASDAGDAGASMLLTAQKGRLALGDGSPVDFRGAISCCGGGFGWPLFDEAWVDYVAAKRTTFLHARVGPFMTSGNGETDWATVGGGYVESNGKADLAAFNPTFWTRVRALIAYARARRIWVEVDVLDGWAVKHCRAGDIPGYSPWEKASNVQATDACATAGSAAVAPGSVHDQWIRKVVLETGRFDNVLYQDGNEIGLVPGYAPAWTTSMKAIVRDEELRDGYPAHLFGTNSGDATAMNAPSVDYLEFHQTQALPASACFGKPCLVNEYNPKPALTPQELHQRFCAAQQQGTYFWYWRHGQSAPDMGTTLDLIAAGCP